MLSSLTIWPLKTNCFLNLESTHHFVQKKNINSGFFRAFISGVDCKCYKVEFLGPKKHSIRPYVVPLALAFEEQVADSNSLDEVVKIDSNLSLESGKNDGEIKNKLKRVDTRVLALSLQAAKTADDVEIVLGDKTDLPLQVYSTIIRAFGKDKKVNAAIALVEWLKLQKPGPNLFIYNSLLGAMKQAEQLDHVEKILNDMVIDGISPNVVTYNTLMGISLVQKHATKALELFNEIGKKGLYPSPASYSTALLAYRRMEDGFGALDFYIEFREKYQNGEIGKNDSKEDWETEAKKLEDFVARICYQVMRRWLVNSKDSRHKVLKLLTCMDQAGLQTGRSEHERLIWACTREDHYVVAKELYNRIRQNDSEISLSVCNHVIWVLGKAKKWWAALEIYEDLLDKGPKPNNMSYELIVSHFNFLLTAARKKGIWKWGIQLLNKMQEKGLKPGSKEWNSVLIACSKASEPSAAIQIFTRMIENGEKPTIISYGALLSALEKGKLYDEAYKVWKHMIKMGVEPNSYSYTIMASVYAAQGKFNIVESILREMPVSGVELNVVTFNAIITACAKNDMSGSAYEWFHRMEVEKIEPNEISYEMLIEALAKDGKPKLAYDLYLRAQDKGLSLSTKAYDMLVEAAVGGGASVDLNLLGSRPPEGIIVAPIVCVVMTIGNSMVVLGLWPAHVVWAYFCILSAKRLGPVMKMVVCILVVPPLGLWPVCAVVGSIVGGLAYGFLGPVFGTFKAVGEGKSNKFRHCVTDGTWDTIKWSLTFVRDLTDVCLYSYFSMMDDLQKQDPPGGRIEIRVVYVPVAILVGLLGFAIDFPVITVIAALKSPYMLLKGWHRLFHDCIGREGPFLESICVPFAGLAILLWPFAVAGALIGSMLASIILGFYAAVISYQESSFYMGICYVIAALSIYDEYSNDILDMPEGSCFPRPKYRHNSGSQSGSTTPTFSRPASFKNPPSRSSSFTTPMIELKPLVLIDSLFQECRRQGEFMVLEGLITVKEIDDAKSGKASGRVISVGLPAYCLFRALLRSAKANSTGILLEDNVMEITSANRPKDTFYDWFLNPLLVIKDQIKAHNLTEFEEDYLGKLVMLSGDAEKLKNLNIGPPPESELRRAELDALARRLQGITKSISRYPTYRRRFENSIKAISEELDRRSAKGRQLVLGSESTLGRMFSNQISFRTRNSNQDDDQEVERDVDVV